MKNTGEQFIPGLSSKRLKDEHLGRYDYFKELCRGKVVLDIACGSGYGSFEISKVAKKVVGVDLSNSVIDYASNNFKKNNLVYLRGDCADIDLGQKFDVILSFETVEHLNNKAREKYYVNIKKHLSEDGFFILSTPNKKVTSPYTNKPLNKHHILEFTKSRLENELKKHFSIKKWYGQRYVSSLYVFKVVRKLIRLVEIIFKKDFGLYSTKYSAEVKEWKSCYEPRVLVVKLTKKVMGNFRWTRKPNFKDIKKIDYNKYWQERGFEINKSLKEREYVIFEMIQTGSSVLDIGCGNSRLPVKLKEKDCNVSVGDISEVVLRSFESFGVKGQRIDLEKIEEINLEKKYDYLILSEVLEHLSNPEEVIDKLKNFANEIIITIPNIAFYKYRIHLFFSGRFPVQWVYHPSEHLRYWSHIDFIDWLKARNLEIILSKSSNGFSFFGLFSDLKNLNKNLFGHQIVYRCKNRNNK